MNTLRYFVALLLCGISLLCAGWFFSLVHNADHISPQVHVNRVFAFLLFLVLGGLLFWLSEYFRKSVKWLPQEPDRRPVIRWWCHNGVTAVCTEEDYQLWWKQHERYLYLKGLMAMPLPHAEKRPAPKFTMFFSDKSLKPVGSDWSGVLWSPDDWKTGGNEELTKLLTGCRAEKTELFVPRNTANWVQSFTTPVSLEAAWKLVHGPNATPED